LKQIPSVERFTSVGARVRVSQRSRIQKNEENMTAERLTAIEVFESGTTLRTAEQKSKAAAKCDWTKALLSTLLAALMAFGPNTPAFGQNPGQDQPAPAAKPTTPATPFSLGLAKHDFSRGPKAFPNLIAVYTPILIEQPNLVNSPRVDDMIHDGKLELSLQDAVELALENNLDIAVQRYNPWIADTNILRAKAGGQGGATPGAAFGGSTANLPFYNFDPSLTATIGDDYRTIPINNGFLAGTGTANVNKLTSHSAIYNFGFTQGFATGTNLSVAWDNTRSSSDARNTFNPSVQGSLVLSAQQQLLNGFGLFVNRRNIMIAKNNRKIADWAFTQQAITTVTSTITTYWELVYARANVKVQQQAVTVAEKLYNDNKKQLEIGTMAPLDVTRAESELATDRGNLIVAQTVQLQQQQVMKSAISKNPLAPNFVNVEIIPADQPNRAESVEAPSFEAAVQEAFAKRPELQEEELNLKNADIDVRATRNALLPTAALSATYGSSGLAGNASIFGPSVITAGQQVVDATGKPVPGLFLPVVTPTVTGTNQSGFTTAQSQIFHNNFPDYAVQLNLTIPLRNRSAQADNERSLLVQRQMQTQMQQLKNSALLDVRNTYIALEQDRARVEAAVKARELQQQTFESEQKKYQLGASTVYQVILTQRDFITAQGTELRALADLVEAKANYERALGRTLEVNRVTIASAKKGEVERETLIPGTLNGIVVGTDKIFEKSGNR
jgi:outer membrane protein